MRLSLQIIIWIGGQLLSHLQKTSSFNFFSYSIVQTQKLFEYLERGKEEREPQKEFIDW